jgi:hypothetical protein
MDCVKCGGKLTWHISKTGKHTGCWKCVVCGRHFASKEMRLDDFNGNQKKKENG